MKAINDEEISFLKKDEEKELPERKLVIKVKQVEDNNTLRDPNTRYSDLSGHFSAIPIVFSRNG